MKVEDVTRADLSGVEHLWSLVNRASSQFQDRIFLDALDLDWPTLSYSQLPGAVVSLAGYFERRGIPVAARVAVSLHNSPLLQFLFVGVMATGRVLVPLNPGMAPDEVAHVLGETEPRWVIVDARLRRRLGDVLARFECYYVSQESEFLRALVSEEPVDPTPLDQMRQSADAEIIFMSGAGGPKGVVLSHRSLLAGSQSIAETFGFDAGTRFLTVCPLFHTSGQMSTTLAPLWVGGVTTAVRSDLAILNFWELVERFRPAWTFVVNSFLALLLEGGPRDQPHSLRGVLAGGSRFTPELIKRFESTFAVRVYQCYGLTETAGTSTCEDRNPVGRSLGSAGRPLGICSVRISREGGDVPAGSLGEIEVEGPNLFTEYLNQPTLTREKKRRGWFRTGDIGFVDEQGNLFVVDRVDRMMIVGGEKLYPAEIERLVPELAGIEAAVATSVPHAVLGAEPVLVYKLQRGASATPEQWKATMGRSLSAFKIPRRFVDVRDLGFERLPQDDAALRAMIERAGERLK